MDGIYDFYYIHGPMQHIWILKLLRMPFGGYRPTPYILHLISTPARTTGPGALEQGSN